jgi:hypothetical protein
MARKTLKDILDQQSEAKATQSYTDLCKLEGPSNA